MFEWLSHYTLELKFVKFSLEDDCYMVILNGFIKIFCHSFLGQCYASRYYMVNLKNERWHWIPQIIIKLLHKEI